MFEVRPFLINTYLAFCDLAVTAADYFVLAALLVLRNGVTLRPGFFLDQCILPLGWVLGIWLASLVYSGMYRSRRLDSVFSDLGILLKASTICGLALQGLARLVPTLEPAPHFLLKLVCLNFLVLCILRVGARSLLHILRRHGHNRKSLMLVATPWLSERLARKIEGRADYGYRIVRRFDFRPGKNAGSDLLPELRAFLNSTHVDDCILGLHGDVRTLTARIVQECESRGINVRVVPDLFPLVQSDTQVYNLDGVPLINVRIYPPDRFAYAVLKRLFDVVFSFAVLVLLAPLYALIALLVKTTSSGPVLFVQERVGLNGRKFKMYKFRTMRQDPSHDPAAHWTTSQSPHVTSLGHWLRRSNLDELPQFWNVLMGDMSIVGPRPERPYFLERFRQEIPEYMLRQYVKSGITGWAQVNGWRGDTSIPERVAHDLYYIQNWALALDIKILALTLTKTFFHRNAY